MIFVYIDPNGKPAHVRLTTENSAVILNFWKFVNKIKIHRCTQEENYAMNNYIQHIDLYVGRYK